MAGCVTVRVYAELNDFVAAEYRGVAASRPFRAHQTVKDVIEAMGVPHTEIDLILIDGEPVSFGYRPRAGDRIAVYPLFEALDIGSIARLRPEPLREPRFVVDVNLGGLARLLRLLGFDVSWDSSAEDHALARITQEEARIVLTRDRGLLKRRAITHGLFVHSDRPLEQAVEVTRRLDLGGRLAPFTRCLRCNGMLVAVPKAEVIDQLEPRTRKYYNEFSRCSHCGRIYWAGSHHHTLESLVDAITQGVTA
ncbi:MAG: Mut7-C RNAse domain-containing protein [Rhodococcus sp. (in: high G+C Gram-positive bacteria)]|uniref:Mut7-C RNAse domain-containing protein n=1 Tax=Rhodococcus sp. TaxID=1831 RepID=UPI003BAE8559